jgi:hypothetical protein
MKIISVNLIKRQFIKLSSKIGIIFLIFNGLLFRKYQKLAFFLLSRYFNYALIFVTLLLLITKNLEFELSIFVAMLFALVLVIRKNLLSKFNFLLNLVAGFLLTYFLLIRFLSI